MTPFQVIVLATPVFLLLIGLEFAWGLRRERLGTGRNNYRLNDAINSISLGVLSQLSGVFSKLLTIGIYSAVYASVALFPDPAFWHSIPGVLLALRCARPAAAPCWAGCFTCRWPWPGCRR
jgi:hypothetical protein